MKNFAMIGAAGYIAPRHLKAIKDTNNKLVACVDLNLDSSKISKDFPRCECFNDFHSFSEHVSTSKKDIDYIVILSPNFLHFEHCSWALNLGIDVICEKPLTLMSDQLNVLEDLEKKNGARVWSILQLRHHESIIKLKEKHSSLSRTKLEVDLTYVTPRNEAYLKTWKGNKKKSGGILFNIGLHFFDMLIHIFGDVKSYEVHHNEPHVLSGIINFKNVTVRWFLSILDKHSPYYQKRDNMTYRSITFNGKELDFSSGFDELHTLSYKDILNNSGFGIEQNRPVMRMLENINNSKATKPNKAFHPFLEAIDNE